MDTNQLSVRFAIVGAIAISLLLPLAMIQGLVDEREHYFNTATQSVTDGWGNTQEILGPLLVVPRRAKGWTVEEAGGQHVVIPASTLEAQIEVAHEIRRRGIFQVPVYVAHVQATGEFDLSALARDETLDWSGAKLVLGISDLHGIRTAALSLAGQTRELQPLPHSHWVPTGLWADAALRQTTPAPFTLSLSLRGSTRLSASLPAASARLGMRSTWPHPSFSGRFLPDSLTTSDDGFVASWIGHELARGLPNRWTADATGRVLQGKAVVVDLFEPVTAYRSVERGIKYGVLFVAVTLLTLLCFELATGLRFHYVQYGVAGLAMLVFFLVLLALAEHLAFGLAYAVASLTMISLTGWYVARMTRTHGLAAVFAVVLGAEYAVLFTLLRMEAYAMLTGTVVVLAGLAALMRTTHSLTTREQPDPDSRRETS